LKMSGLPNRARASLSASTQNPAVSVFDSRQDSTRPIDDRDQVQKSLPHRYVGYVSGPHVVGPVDRLAAQKVRVDLVLICSGRFSSARPIGKADQHDALTKCVRGGAIASKSPVDLPAALGRRQRVAHNSTGPTSVSIDLGFRRGAGAGPQD
jgi:hypothetical protein